MNVAELIEALEGQDPQAEVRLATQPNWPLAFHLSGVVSQKEIDRGEDDEDCGHSVPQEGCLCSGPDPEAEEKETIVWLAEGGSVYDAPYAPRGVWGGGY
jgi:hypothetical protein